MGRVGGPCRASWRKMADTAGWRRRFAGLDHGMGICIARRICGRGRRDGRHARGDVQESARKGARAVCARSGWIAWVVTFATFVFRRTSNDSAWIVRALLVAFAIVSLVGIPAQHLVVAFTFWTAAFWYVMLAGRAAGSPAPTRASWAVVAAV